MRRATSILSIVAIVAAIVQLIVLASVGTEAAASLSLPVQEQSEERVAAVQPAVKPFEGFPLNETRVIQFQVGEQTFSRLSKREQGDQLLDWLLYTVTSDAGLSLEEINESLYDVPSIRYGYVRPVANFEYGNTRSVYIGDGQVIALVPADLPEERADQLAQIADRHRKNTGEIPATLLIFEYRIDREKETGWLTRRESVDGRELFTAKYGYSETQIANLDTLQAFMAQVNDLTFAQVHGNSLTLGGRKIQGQEYLGIKDMAAVWQAHSEILAKLRAFDSRWDQRIEAFKFTWSTKTYKYDSERIALERQMQEEFKKLMTEREQEHQGLELVNGTGFSLDPFYDFTGLQELFEKIKPKYVEVAEGSGAPISQGDIQEAEVGLAQQDAVPYLRLAKKLSNSSDPDAVILGASTTEVVRRTYQYQAARYDGNLQGTEVGMTLFYTDLLAKLWAIDYRSSTPRHIEDFNSLTNLQLPLIYRQEMIELPNTRLWFGTQRNGFQVVDGGNSLLFARVATRVYSASSNPLEPGVEVPATAGSSLFLDWWNDHYDEVARYEPQYERLNEIMKWSTLISWLSEANREGLLGFLKDVKVTRTNRFPDWVQNHPELRYQAWDKEMFLPQGYLGTTTEAIPILFSEPYSLFIDDVADPWVLSGGVSLADVDLFKGIVPLPEGVDKLLLRSTIEYPANGTLGTTLRTLDNTEYSFTGLADDLISVTSQAGGKGVRLRSLDSELVNQPFQRIISQGKVGPGLEFETRAAGTGLGALDISPTENGFKIDWLSRDIDAGQQLARAMSRGQSIRETLLESGDVKMVVQLADEEFLFQTKGSKTWLRVAKEGSPSVEVPSGWQTRVADPQSGVYGILIDWGDDAAASLKRGGYFVRSASDDAVLKFVSGNPPTGLRTVEIVRGKLTVRARVNPATGEFYFSWDELPDVVRDDLSLLQELTTPSELGRIQPMLVGSANQVVRYVPENWLLEHASLDRDIAGENFEGLARQIVAQPAETKRLLDSYLTQRLGQIDDLLTHGQPPDALRELDELSKIYGHGPELEFRRALAYVEQSEIEMAANALREGSSRSMRRQPSFLDEINQRLRQSAPGTAEADNLYCVAEYADWNDLHRLQLVPDGQMLAVPEGNRLALHYQLGEMPTGQPVLASAVGEDAAVYVQDVPSLNNVDWSVPIEQSLDEVASGELGTVIRLPRGDIAHFNPSRIYSPDGTQFRRVTRPVVRPSLLAYTPYKPSNCPDDDCRDREEKAVYVVMAK